MKTHRIMYCIFFLIQLFLRFEIDLFETRPIRWVVYSEFLIIKCTINSPAEALWNYISFRYICRYSRRNCTSIFVTIPVKENDHFFLYDKKAPFRHLENRLINFIQHIRRTDVVKKSGKNKSRRKKDQENICSKFINHRRSKQLERVEM
jgi:hypothetical protein